MKNLKFWWPVIASLIATPVFIILGIGSGGAGHGDYLLAKTLFPYTMFSPVLFGTISTPFIVLANIQFPLCGLTLGAAACRGRIFQVMLFILALHGLTVAACFATHSESFS